LWFSFAGRGDHVWFNFACIKRNIFIEYPVALLLRFVVVSSTLSTRQRIIFFQIVPPTGICCRFILLPSFHISFVGEFFSIYAFARIGNAWSCKNTIGLPFWMLFGLHFIFSQSVGIVTKNKRDDYFRPFLTLLSVSLLLLSR
jgi:hypothetical protein